MPICQDGTPVIDSSLCPEFQDNIDDKLSNVSFVVVSDSGNQWVDSDGNTTDIPTPDINELNEPDTPIKQSFDNTNVDNNSTVEQKSNLLLTLTENSRHLGQQIKVLSDVNKKSVEALNYNNDLQVAQLQLQADNNTLLKKIFESLTLNNQIKSTELKNNASIESLKVDLETAKIIQNYDANVELKKMGTTAELKKEDLEFNKNGNSNFKDSEGNIIKPREAKALNYVEQAKQFLFENLLDLDSFFDDISTAYDETTDNDTNYLIERLKQSMEITPDAIKLLDELNNINREV